MPEREPMSPDVAAALRAYEIEMRDGTERGQKEAFRELQEAQRALGNAAVAIATQTEQPSRPKPEEQQLAAS